MGDKKNARAIWKGENLEFHGVLGSGYEFEMSSDAGTHGGSPMEIFLAGVAGCTAVDIVLILKKMQKNITGLEVEIIGTRADEIPKVYTDAELFYTITGDVDAKSVESAIKLTKEKYCSASIMFAAAGVQFSTSYEIVRSGGG